MFLSLPQQTDDKDLLSLKNEDLFDFFSTYIKHLEELKNFYPESTWLQETEKTLEEFLNYYKAKLKTTDQTSE